MADRYLRKGVDGPGHYVPRIANIAGTLNIGTGGMLNAATASGTVYASTIPTGWVGGYSGVVGLLGAGVQSVARTATGTYQLMLEDGWAKKEVAIQLTASLGVPSGSGLGVSTGYFNPVVGQAQIGPGFGGARLGNPALTSSQGNVVVLCINPLTGLVVDPQPGAGIYIHMILCDTTNKDLQ